MFPVDQAGKVGRFITMNRRSSPERRVAPNDWPCWLRYVLAISIVALATVVRASFFHLGTVGLYYISFYPAVFLSAFFLGTGPGFLAVFLSAFAAAYWIEPIGSFYISSFGERIGLPTFVVVNMAIVWVCKRERRAIQLAAQAEAARQSGEAIVQQAEALRESEARSRAFFDNVGVGIIEVEKDDRVATVNDRACKILGYRREEMLGMTIDELTAPEDRDTSTRLNAHVHQGVNDIVEYEKRYLKRDGSRLWAHVTVSGIRDGSGRWCRGIGTIENITERKVAEEQLRQLSQAVEQSPSSIMITDTHGNIEYVNPKFTEITGYSFDEVVGKNPRILKSGETLPEAYKELWDTIIAGHEWRGEFRNRKKSGELFWEAASICSITDDASNITHFLGIKEDITDRKIAEIALAEAKEAAQQANKAKDTFISSLSHELRTPLTPLLLSVTALEKDPALNIEAQNQLGLMRHNIETEAHLIDDLLDISRIASGKIALRPVETDVNELLSKALEIVREDIERKDLAVHLERGATCTRANVDSVRIQQVFWNLLKNAAKFTPLNGSIFVRTFNPEPQSLCIEIRDTGIGIAPEFFEKIFIPFEQGPVAGDRQYGGLGLGLPISKAIVGFHGGSISVSSAGPNQGATFTVRLPACKPAIPATARTTPVATVPRAVSNLNILLVEDDENTRSVICRLLTRDGHHVKAVGTCCAAFRSAQAVKTGEAKPFQVLISDLGLPDGSGLDVVREIRACNPGVRAVAVSGYGTDEDVRTSLEAGFNTHLTKPISIDDVRRALAA